MVHQKGRVVSEILNRYFGEIVQQVGNDLFKYGSRPISMIVRSTGLTRTKVIESLRSLLKYDLASFEPSSNEAVADYRLLPDNVLLLIRYPRYLLQMKTKFGSEAELIVEELLQNGICTATKILVTLAKKHQDDKEKNITIVSLKDTFVSLATAAYIQQAPAPDVREEAAVPALVNIATIVPEFDVRHLMMVSSGDVEDTDNVYWKVNYDRFHQDFRDDVIVQMMTRRIDDNAGEITRQLLSLVRSGSAEWAAHSSPVSALDLKHALRRAAYATHIDQYLRVMEECSGGVLSRAGEAGGGQVSLGAGRGAELAARCVAEHLVAERLGHRAARIFRLINDKKYIEEDDIQKHAMLPNKECKELTYKLLEEHFISVQPMRKTATGGGLVKAIYLYYINFHEVSHGVSQQCWRALHNVLVAAAAARRSHARLLDKRRRVASILHGMRARGDDHHHIHDVEETITPPERALIQTVESRLKQLSVAEIELDRTLFILQWYFMYDNKPIK